MVVAIAVFMSNAPPSMRIIYSTNHISFIDAYCVDSTIGHVDPRFKQGSECVYRDECLHLHAISERLMTKWFYSVCATVHMTKVLLYVNCQKKEKTRMTNSAGHRTCDLSLNEMEQKRIDYSMYDLDFTTFYYSHFDGISDNLFIFIDVGT